MGTLPRDSYGEPEVKPGTIPRTGRARFLAEKLLGLLSPLVLITGLVSYAVVYLAYDYVYAGIKVNPSELGLTYISLLGRSPGAVIIISVAIAILLFWRRFAGLVICGLFIVYFLANSVISNEQERQRTESNGQALIISSWIISASQIPISSVMQFIRDIKKARESLIGGAEVPPGNLFGITVINVTAVPSKLVWLEDPTNSPMRQNASKLGSGCVTYLGASDGFSVIYSPKEKTVVRLPVDKVIVARFESVKGCEG